jgi:hypothetical protein
MFSILHLKCFLAFGTGGAVREGRVRERRQERSGRAEDKNAVDAISIPFYFDMRGRDSVLFRYAGRTVLQRESASGRILGAGRPDARSVV